MRRSPVLLLLLAACAPITPYQVEVPAGSGTWLSPSGGYSDTPLGGGRYRVDVRGNGYTGMQQVRNIALVRAADLALSAGYRGFVVQESGSDSRTVGGIRQFPFASLVVRFSNEADAVNAAQVLRSLGPSVGYRREQ